MEAVAEDDDVEIAESVGEDVAESQSMSMSLSVGRRGESLKVEEEREEILLLLLVIFPLPLQPLLLMRPSRSSIGLTPDEAERKAQDSENERQREFLKRREIRLAEADPVNTHKKKKKVSRKSSGTRKKKIYGVSQPSNHPQQNCN